MLLINYYNNIKAESFLFYIINDNFILLDYKTIILMPTLVSYTIEFAFQDFLNISIELVILCNQQWEPRLFWPVGSNELVHRSEWNSFD